MLTQLKKEYPPAAAGLLARILPPGEAEPGAGGTVTVNILSVPSGWMVSQADGERIKNGLEPVGPLVDARARNGLGEPSPVIEHTEPEPAPAPPIKGTPRLAVIKNDPDPAA
jgi:hypothetical protein